VEAAGGEVPAAPVFDAELGRRRPLRVLLAEDNAVNQKVAQRLLERLGYRADVAGDGREAVAALRQQTYDVIFMDVQMPEIDGLEATRLILDEWPPERRPRIVAMTANMMKEDREACLAAGMDDYLAKPIRVEELVAALNRCQPLVGGPAEGPGDAARSDPSARLNQAALDNVRALAGGDMAFVAELIDTFLADVPQLLAQMRRAVEAGDAATLRRAAHSLKSNSAEFGAGALADLCRELEAMGRTGLEAGDAEWAGAETAETLARAEVAFEKIRPVLEDVRRTAAGAPRGEGE
jgi:CheY-like chemotaxis protein